MVVFTCQKCGESLQKPKVEKHIQFVCRGSPLLSCVDCLKDFRGSEYVSHTQCVTETERYSAKGFTPKPNFQKGLSKQNLWNDMVKEVLKRQDLGVEERSLLNKIHTFQNIPRKRSKFHNFIKSATRCDSSSADALFDLLESEWNTFTKNREGDGMTSSRTEPLNSSEKKSSKDNAAEAQEKSLNNIQDAALVDECEGEKMCNGSEDGKQLSKKEKKQKRKRDKYLAEVNSIENNKNAETVEEINAHKKSKNEEYI